MPAKTHFSANKVCDKLFGQTDFTPPTDWYIGFLDVDENELTGGDYARVEIENSVANFPNAVAGSKTCQAAITTPEASADWDEARFIAFFDADTGGNMWFMKPITPFTVLTGMDYTIPIGNLIPSET